MKFVKQVLSAGAFLLLFFFSCKKEGAQKPGIDLSNVRMTDFQLVETTYSDITITHPVINDGVEIQGGEIEVVVPKGTTQLQLTPKTANFSKEGFSISPALNVKQNFLNRVILYRIASTADQSNAVNYHVRIREEAEVETGNVEITGFSFQKAKNPALPADIESARILQGVGTISKIFVFVPPGTDFANLTPDITHNGTGLFYSQDPASTPATTTTVYPANGTAIDFAYPKVFYAVVKKGDASRTYSVIVDVREPIVFGQPAVTTANLKAGKNQLVTATTFTNRGNHPVSIAGITHSQQQPAGFNVLRGLASVPAFGLLPGATGTVQASVAAQSFPSGTYKVTSTFKPRLVNTPEADDLLLESALGITTTITN